MTVQSPPSTVSVPLLSRRAGWLIVALLIAAFTLRLYRLDVPSLWVDEGFTAHNAALSLWEIPSELARTDNHPPLHYIILNLWGALAGNSVFALRFVSVGAGLLTVVILAQLGRLLFSAPAGLFAAALLAVSPFHVWYSQEARMYALVALWGSLALLLLAMLLSLPRTKDVPTRTKQRLLWLGYVVAVTLSLYSHYYAFFLLVVGFLMVLFWGRRSYFLRPWLLSQVAVALLYLPWLPAMFMQYLRAEPGFRVPLGLPQVLFNLGSAFTVGELAFYPYSDALVVVSLLVAALGTLPLGQPERLDRGKVLGIVLAWLLVPALVAYLLSAAFGIDLRATGRMYYIVSLPAFVLLAARGLNLARQLYLAPALLGCLGLVAISSLSLNDQYFNHPKEEFRNAAAYIEEHGWQGDTIVLNAEHIYPAFAYYYEGPLVWHRAEVGDEQSTDKWLAKTTMGKGRAWLVLSHQEVSDPRGLVLDWFERHGVLVDERWLPGVRLAAFSMEPRPNLEPIEPPQARPIDFQEKLDLLGFSLDSPPDNARFIRVRLYWHNVVKQSEDYHVNLLLFDKWGNLWSQLDKVPLAEGYKSRSWAPGEYLTDYYELPVPPGTPPQEFELRVQVYSAETKQVLQAQVDGKQALGGQALLGKVLLPRAPLVSKEAALQSVESMLQRSLDDSLELLGYTATPQQSSPGIDVFLTLLWQVEGTVRQPETFELQLLRRNGDPVSAAPLFPREGSANPESWERGDLVRTIHRLRLPGDLDSGTYRLAIQKQDPLKRTKTTPLELASIRITAPQRVYTLPDVEHKQTANFADRIGLLGYSLDKETYAPGDTVRLTLFWQDLNLLSDSFSVFTHLIDEEERLVAQHDGIPAEGQRPTITWALGEVIQDEHPIVLPKDLPPGNYRIALGLYLTESGQRLQLMPGSEGLALEDRLILQRTLKVVAEER